MISSSSNQIVLPSDPFGYDPFGMGDGVREFCFNTTQWLEQQQQFRDIAVKFGYIALAIGFAIGALTMWLYYRNKYGSSE